MCAPSTPSCAASPSVEPKMSEAERRIAQMENDLKAAFGREATRLPDRLNDSRTFLGELRDLREELLRIAALPCKPDLNDGVIINAAPLLSFSGCAPGPRTRRTANGSSNKATTTGRPWLIRYGPTASGRFVNATIPSLSPTGLRTSARSKPRNPRRKAAAAVGKQILKEACWRK